MSVKNRPSPSDLPVPGTPMPSVVTTPLVVVSVVFPVLAAISIYLRLVAKRWGRQPYHADDWWVIITWFLTIPISVLFWFFAAQSGVDTWDIDGSQGACDSLELLITVVDPISESWYGGRLGFDMKAMGLSQVGTSIALDIVVLCFPLPIVFRMLLEPRKKIMVFAMFWLGAFCCIAAIIRLILLEESLKRFARSPESVYHQSNQYIFMLIEPNCSIIAACLPCYGPFIWKTRDRIAKSDRIRSMSYTQNGTSKRGTGPSSTHEGSCLRKPESQAQLNVRYGWPGESRSHVLTETLP